MTSKALGIGDETRADLVNVREQYDLPKTRKEVIDLVSTILGGGGVQRLVIAVREPVVVTRAVPKDEARLPAEVPQHELWEAARFAELEEFNFDTELSAHEHLFRAFAQLTKKKLRPRALLVQSPIDLRRWLEIDLNADLPEVFGVEVVVYPEFPEDTALLLGIVPGQEGRIAAGLRMSMNLPPL